MMSRSSPLIASVLTFSLAAAVHAQTTSTSTPANPPQTLEGSRYWLTAGAGLTVSRLGCDACDRAGVFGDNHEWLLAAGFRVTPKVDAGVEFAFVGSTLPTRESVRTTFILGSSQLRPWPQRGFFLKVGMGFGFVGNGLYSPIGPALAPPYTTNALALTYGAGWMFKPYRRFTLQASATHRVVALGALTTEGGTTVANVVGNYWTAGLGVIIR